MADLDSPGSYEALDKGGMGSHLHRLPAQCRQAWEQAQEIALPLGYEGIEKVVVVGMGGSAIGGDLVQALARLEDKPVLVHRDYAPVPVQDGTTLTIFSSYSGMTEETLSALRDSLGTAARKVAFTSGGELAEIARQRGIPLFPIDYAAPPRAVIGYSFIGLLGLLCRTRFLADKAADLNQALAGLEGVVRRLDVSRPLAENPAKGLAGRLHGRLPLIYGAGFLEPVARRWKTQFNENSKVSACYEVLPELNHNAVVGYRFPPSLARQSFAVLLSSAQLHPRTRLRYQITGEILEQYGVEYQMVAGEGESPLSQMLSLVLWGDFVSYYLALLYDTDPSPVPAIDYLKERMGQYGLQVQ